MSLRERTPPFGSLRQGLTRSSSFGGLLMTPSSGRRSLGGSGGGTLRSGWVDMGVLGQALPLSPRDRRMGSLPPYVKVPKAPRTQRATLIASSVAKGVRDCVGVTRKDLFALTRAQHDYRRAKSQGKVYEIDKQIKAAERYLKRLEYLLSQVEDMQDQYSLNQRLRDGARTMAYAYALSPGKDKASALSNVRSGYKECTDTLCGLEVQIERLIGTFTMEMKGIQGFARLCPGDVFEVTVKHGSQKWKIRGKIGKDNSQTWDNPVHIFKALIGDMLVIKAAEVRLLGKSTIIGNKVCETKDLFSPYPQLMTINLNASGSLKLSIFVSWNPLDYGAEETMIRASSLSGPSPRIGRKSIVHPLGSPHKNNYEGDQDSSFGSMSARSSTAGSASPGSECRGTPSSQALSTRTENSSPVSDIQAMGLGRRRDSHDDSISFDGRDSASPQCDDTGNFTLVRKTENRVEQWARYSQYNGNYGSSPKVSNMDIMSRSFPNLNTTDIPVTTTITTTTTAATMTPTISTYHTSNSPSQSDILSQSFSHQLNLLSGSDPEHGKWTDAHAWDSSMPSSLPKIVSRLRSCLEDIQGQFPQLHALEEAVLDLHELCKQHHGRSRRDSNTSEISLSVESALECFDFLNAECDDDFGDDNPEECLAKNQKESLAALNGKDFLGGVPPPPVTGSAQLDAFLLIHLQHSLRLIQDLGSFGPLRRKETESLSKLEEEGKLLRVVLSHKHNFDSLRPQHIMPVPHVQVLWDSVTLGEDWCVTAGEVVQGLLPVVSSLLDPDDDDNDFPVKVMEELVRQITDSEIYSDCLTVTAGHFLAHLMKPLQEMVPEIADALKCSMLLSQRDPASIENGLTLLQRVTLSSTRLISHHLLGPLEFSSPIERYIENNRNNEFILTSLYDKCLLLLESSNPCDRSSACTLLSFLFPFLSAGKEEKEETKNEGKIEEEQKEWSKNPTENHNKDENVNKEQDGLEINENCTEKSTEDLLVIGSSFTTLADDSKQTHPPNDQRKESSAPRLHKISQGEDNESIAVLSFLQQNDPSQEVRNSARVALLNLGTRGQDALQQVQLSSHGFQGLDVREDTRK